MTAEEIAPTAREAALATENARLRKKLAEAESTVEFVNAGNLNATLRDTEGRLRLILESATDFAIITIDLAGHITGWNAGARNILGWEEAEVLGRDGGLIWTPEDRAAHAPEAEMHAAREVGRAVDERWHIKRDGSRFWGSGYLTPMHDDTGALLGYLKILRDHTEQRFAVAALRASEERLRLIVESAVDYAIFTLNDQGLVTSWNSGAARILGWEAQEIVGHPVKLLFVPEDVAAGVPETEVKAGLAQGHVEDERWMTRRDGTRFWASQTLARLQDEGSEARDLLKIVRDHTEARFAQERMRESEARFRHMADSAPAPIWMTDATGRVTFVNRHYEYLFGLPASALLGEGWTRIVLPEDLERHTAAFFTAFHARGSFQTETRVLDRHGQVRWLRCDGVPRTDDGGRFLGYTGCNVDITEARVATEELEARIVERTRDLADALEALRAETAKRSRAEDARRHGQKLEAIGQLTGGIAHDFNNMLQGVAGSLEIARLRVTQGRAEEVGRHLDRAYEAAQRAAGLTQRLLAFARRQRLEPKAIEPDALIAGMADLIRRTMGPAVTVDLKLRDGAWGVLCDESEIENALLNLCINARDAMAEGGQLTIGTADVHLSVVDVEELEGITPGDYVVISVGDTGEGIPREMLTRVFEPFYTTKPVGQGTGLGLSQVYGFVRQSGGTVRIQSAPGQGTTVRIYLPRHERPEIATAQKLTPALEHIGGGGNVLLVDDEVVARESAAERLRELGYTVLEAVDGPAALQVLQGDVRPDLLITDVGLPNGMNGRQVAEAAREQLPDLPVLFITGYAGTALPAGVEVINKPFELDTLVRRVQAILRPTP